MEKLQLKDFLNYAYISNLKASDDKERLAFVVSAANAAIMKRVLFGRIMIISYLRRCVMRQIKRRLLMVKN